MSRGVENLAARWQTPAGWRVSDGCTILGCGRSGVARGMCWSHYQRARRGSPVLVYVEGHGGGGRVDKKFGPPCPPRKVRRMLRIKWEVETLWTPEPMTGCFLWLGDGYASGYGRVGSSTDPWGGYVHRAVMHFAGVALERGLQRHVRHICDNRMCVNPSHLAYGTAADNVRDRSARWVREGKRWGHWLSGFPRKYGDEQIAGIPCRRERGAARFRCGG